MSGMRRRKAGKAKYEPSDRLWIPVNVSQRGEDKDQRPDGLPSWTGYFFTFKEKFHLQISLRTVQCAFRKMDGPKLPAAPTPKAKPLVLSAHDRRRLVEAAVVGNELVEAWEQGGDVESAVNEYKRIAVDSRKLDSIVNPPEPDVNNIADRRLDPAENRPTLFAYFRDTTLENRSKRMQVGLESARKRQTT
jgi:hypothetical protein